MPAGPALQPAADWRCRAAPAIEDRLAGRRGDDTLSGSQRAELTALYGPGQSCALWTTASGALSSDAHEALALLGGVSADGLDEDDYGLPDLQRPGPVIEGASPPDAGQLAAFDVRLSAAILRYFRDLHLGRVDPRTAGVRLDAAHERHDFAGMLRAALATHQLRTTAAGLAPSLPQYAALRRQLAVYRTLGDAAGPALPAVVRSVRPGERYAGAELLRRRLAAFGDLPAATPSDLGDIYDPVLAAGIARFQARHGLAADGVLGRATLACLSVPVRARVRQIELALERLRWLPDIADERVIALNIPMFRLGAWEPSSRPGPALGMRVIVGRALNTQTPVFTAVMQSVIFRPYWNVPRSILLGEVLPALAADPDLLRRSDFEIVDGEGDDARVVAATEATLARLRAGELRVRQRPGPKNALGLVKFDMPNEATVYLHGTPAMRLFEKPRRDFSHGCIRVEDPAALAAWVLRDEPGWDRDRIEAAMTAPQSSRVYLTRPVRVVLFYTTAAVVAADGTLHFAEDIYRLDARLDAALNAPRLSRASARGNASAASQPDRSRERRTVVPFVEARVG